MKITRTSGPARSTQIAKPKQTTPQSNSSNTGKLDTMTLGQHVGSTLFGAGLGLAPGLAFGNPGAGIKLGAVAMTTLGALHDIQARQENGSLSPVLARTAQAMVAVGCGAAIAGGTGALIGAGASATLGAGLLTGAAIRKCGARESLAIASGVVASTSVAALTGALLGGTNGALIGAGCVLAPAGLALAGFAVGGAAFSFAFN